VYSIALLVFAFMSSQDNSEQQAAQEAAALMTHFKQEYRPEATARSATCLTA
jgi:hypothetical protein